MDRPGSCQVDYVLYCTVQCTGTVQVQVLQTHVLNRYSTTGSGTIQVQYYRLRYCTGTVLQAQVLYRYSTTGSGTVQVQYYRLRYCTGTVLQAQVLYRRVYYYSYWSGVVLDG